MIHPESPIKNVASLPGWIQAITWIYTNPGQTVWIEVYDYETRFLKGPVKYYVHVDLGGTHVDGYRGFTKIE